MLFELRLLSFQENVSDRGDLQHVTPATCCRSLLLCALRKTELAQTLFNFKCTL